MFSANQLADEFNLLSSNNMLTGSIPEVIYKLNSVYIDNNYLCGTIPSTSYSCRLSQLLLHRHRLSGTIPNSLTNCTALTTFTANNNHLSGRLPSGILKLGFLDTLQVAYNLLSGRIFNADLLPAQQSNLTVISIGNNLFSGQFLSRFEKFPLIQRLFAAVNCFDGSISDSICGSANLSYLDLGGSGANPLCQQNINAQQRLPFFVKGEFSSLGLRGTLPSCLLSLVDLELLSLSGTANIYLFIYLYTIDLTMAIFY